MTPDKELERVKAQLPQAILGALEYRGFDDCGKYLDEDIWEYTEPLLQSYAQSELRAFGEDIETLKADMATSISASNFWTVYNQALDDVKALLEKRPKE